jgi:hypothetical protein
LHTKDFSIFIYFYLQSEIGLILSDQKSIFLENKTVQHLVAVYRWLQQNFLMLLLIFPLYKINLLQKNELLQLLY